MSDHDVGTPVNKGGTLSRRIPAHTKTITFRWCKLDFMKFGIFRDARVKMGMSVLQGGKCGWCRKPFEPTDMMALANPEEGANMLLCQECAKSIRVGECPSP